MSTHCHSFEQLGPQHEPLDYLSHVICNCSIFIFLVLIRSEDISIYVSIYLWLQQRTLNQNMEPDTSLICCNPFVDNILISPVIYIEGAKKIVWFGTRNNSNR